MTITVPRAGVIAGRSARPVAPEPPQGGAALEALGGAIRQLGDRIEGERLDREAQALQLDMTRELGRARLEFEQLTDPDQIDRGWQARVAELRAGYFDAPAGGRPRVDPRLRTRLEGAFGQLEVSHGLALGQQAINLRNSWREATWIDYRQEVTGQAAAADPTTRATLLAQAQGQIDALLAAGTITPEEAAARKQALTGDVLNAAAITAIDADPEVFLRQADEGLFAGLPAETLAQRRVQATAALERRVAAEAAEAERQTQQQARRINDELDTVTAILGKGRMPTAAQLALLSDPRTAGLADPEKLAEAQAAQALSIEQPTLGRMNLTQLDALIAAERGGTIARAYQAERLTVLERLREEKAEGLRTDPVAFAQGRGEAFTDPVAFDPADEVGFRVALKSRLTDADLYARREGIARPSIPLSAEEQAQLKELAGTLPSAERVVLARSLAAELGATAAEAITGSPVLAHVGGLAAAGGLPQTAAETLRGQEAIDAGTFILPPLRDRVAPVFDQTADLFADIEGGEAMLARTVAAADALYAARARRVDPAGAIDEDLYRQALHEVMGGTGTYYGRDARGGVQEVRGALTILPRGVAAGEVETALDRLGTRTQPDALGRRSARVPSEAALREDLARVSADGSLPDIAGMLPDARTLSRYRLEAAGDNLFVMIDRDGDVLSTADGQPWRFRMSTLLSGVRP